MPPKAHVILFFMIQFIIVIMGFGILVPALHRRGVPTILLIVGSLAALFLMHLVLGALAKLIPVRCRSCRSASRFQGFGWWPFIYRYKCSKCGEQLRLEVSGG